MQSDCPSRNEMPAGASIFFPGAFFALAIEHMSAYICGITDWTFGVSG
jgi:hypothetical protein